MLKKLLVYPYRSCAAIIITYVFLVNAVPVNASENGLFSRASLLDGPGSPKARLRERGININASITHFLQDLVSTNDFESTQSGGKTDIYLTLDGHKLGLWRGVSLNMHTELLFGDSVNFSGNRRLIPVNTALAFPRVGGSDQEISLTLRQLINKRTSLTIGKFNMLDAASRTPLIGGGGIDTFMNLGLAAPISGVTPAYLIGGLLGHNAGFASFGLFVYDPRSAQDSEVLENLFDDGVTTSLSVAVPTTVMGNRTVHRFRGVYSTQNGVDLSNIPELNLPSQNLGKLGKRSGYWYLSYAFQHFLFQDSADPSRGWGIFGQIAMSDGNPNPVDSSGFIGIGGTSPLPNRSLDRFGIALFYYSLSDYIVDGLRPTGFILEDEQGFEAFYSLALAPWLSISGDLQVIDSAYSNSETSIYLGLRTQVKF